MAKPGWRTDLRRIRDGLREEARTAMWGLRIVWQQSPAFVLASVALMVIRGLLPAALALVIKGLVDAVVAIVAHGGSTDAMIPWIAATFILALMEGLAWFVERYVIDRLSDDLEVRASVDVLRHAATLDLGFLEDPERRDLIQRAQADTGRRLANLMQDLQMTATTALQAASLFAVLISIEPLVALVIPPVSLPFMVFQWRLAKQRYEDEHVRTTKRRWSQYYSGLLTSPYSVPETRLLNLPPLLLGRYRSLLEEFRDRNKVLHKRNLVGSSLATFLVILGLYALFAKVAFGVVSGAATVGDLAIFTGAAGRLRTSVDMGIRSISRALEQTLYISNLMEFLRVESVMEPGTLRLPPASHGAALSIRDVVFRYPGTTQVILSGVSFEVRPGETVALVGENGAGKTTLAKLIARFYDPDQGEIQLDGLDLREVDPEDLHARVSFIFQTFGRYEGTVRENIAYGNWEELLDRPDRVEAVARKAGVDGLIESLPDGYETMLGRLFGKVTMSGGQWQQLALARALARDASLIVLDEPTANLDPRAEFELFTRFKSLAAGRTTIIISHRFSTIAMADRIVVLSGGQIVEQGSHQELMDLEGSYAALYRLHRGQMPGMEL